MTDCHAFPLPLRRAAAEGVVDRLALLGAVTILDRETTVLVMEGALVREDTEMIEVFKKWLLEHHR